MAERCQAITKSGKPCSALAVAESLCAWHAPSWEAKRRQWSAEGGRKRSNRERAKKALPAAVLSTEELQGLLCTTLKGLLANKIAPNVANAAAALSRSIVTVREATTLEARLAELEAAVGLHERKSG